MKSSCNLSFLSKTGGDRRGPSKVKVFSSLSALAVFSLLLTGVVSSAPTVASAAVGTRTVTRISGVDRYSTAVAISQKGFPSHANTVFITTGVDYPDALSAIPAAVAQQAPLLLTAPDVLAAAVQNEIVRLAPSAIVIVGGLASVSSGVEASLRSLAPTVKRISGPDRYATSRAVATYAFGAAGAATAYIATGTNFPDALSSGSAAGSHGSPIILVDGTTTAIDQPTSSLITSLKTSMAKIAGGVASVSSGIQTSLNQQTSTIRLSGPDRYATSVALNHDAYPSSSIAYLASGDNFPDALAGAVLAGAQKAPLFVIPSTCVPQATLDELDRIGVTNVVILGGLASLSSAVDTLTSCDSVDLAAMPVGNLTGWTQTGAQDFITPAALGQVGAVYGSDMRGYSGFKDTSGHGMYSPDTVLSVSNGALDYYLHTNAAGQPQVATPIPFGYTGQTYGRYSVRFRADTIPGYKIAFLLWPHSDNWNEGEIDWPEGNLSTTRMSPHSAMKGTYSSTGMKFDSLTNYNSAPTDSSTWHVATTEWTPGIVKFYWDGALVSQTTVPAGVPTTPFRWTLQAETEIGPTTLPPATSQGHVQVDWAVQYAYTPAP